MTDLFKALTNLAKNLSRMVMRINKLLDLMIEEEEKST